MLNCKKLYVPTTTNVFALVNTLQFAMSLDYFQPLRKVDLFLEIGEYCFVAISMYCCEKYNKYKVLSGIYLHLSIHLNNIITTL